MPNKYVTFVSDEIFLQEVKKVVDAYAKEADLSKTPWEILTNSNETIDQLKTLFDIYSNSFSLSKWGDFEVPRQHDKKASNRVADFHQNLLGRVDGWENLGRGHPTGMDLKKEDDSVWIELKNKYNTMNSASLRDTRFKCEELAEKYPNAKIYWAYIVAENYETFDIVWEYTDNKENVVHEKNDNIRNIGGEKVYTLVTGDETAFKQVFEAIPKAINDIKNSEFDLTGEDKKIFENYKKLIFKD